MSDEIRSDAERTVAIIAREVEKIAAARLRSADGHYGAAFDGIVKRGKAK